VKEPSAASQNDIKPENNKVEKDTTTTLKVEAVSTSDSDFNKYVLNTLLKDKTVEVSDASLANIFSKEQKAAFEELKLATFSTDYEVTDQFKIKLFEAITLDKINSQIKNISIALKCFASKEDSISLRIIANQLLKSEKDFNNLSKQISRQSLFPRTKLYHLKESIQELAAYKKAGVPIQIKFIAFFAHHGIDPTKNIKSLANLTKEFNSLTEDSQIEVLTNLRSWDFNSVIQFFTHLDAENIRINVLNLMRSSITPYELYKFYKWQNPDSNLNTESFFLKIVKPSCETFFKQNSSLEDLLLIWPLIVDPKYKFDLNSIRVKFKSLVNRENYLAESLQDPALPKLQDELFRTREDLKISENTREDLQNRIKVATLRENQILEELSELKKKRIENSKENLSGVNAMERQTKIDQIREFLPLLDLVSTSLDNSEILKILESIGIEVIGRVGQKAKWNSLFCESLAGDEMAEGVVVRSGYTWFSGKEVIPVRRMLLKSE
jgi:hypothetical protein